jgi:type IV secretory pathway VirD2 relaxase
MAGDDDFELWLGGRRSARNSDRSFLQQVQKAANLAGRTHRSTARTRRFDGSRIGRGASHGRILSDRIHGARARRVIVKARFVRLAGKGAAAATAHLRYLQRDGTTRSGERGALYGPETDHADGKAFIEAGRQDRHQFRFIVAPEDGAEYEDLKPLTRRLMAQVELDLGTKLDWVAVDHFNTGHPHTHILVRGVDDRRKDLIIAREYMTHGFRERAAELVNLDLGPRSELEIEGAQRREVTQERFTGIDRRLINAIDADGLVAPAHRDSVEQSLRAGRLQTLGRMGLAAEERRGQWRLDNDLEKTLREMGQRGDIIATLHREMRAVRRDVSPQDYAIFDPAEGKAAPLIGRVVAHGLADDYTDSHYLVVDGVDGRSHYVGIGDAVTDEGPPLQAIVRITAHPVAVRQADRTITEVAARNGGIYSIDHHLKTDPAATEDYAETHVRRLEAMRRISNNVERRPSGEWIIAPDHLARVEAYERKLSERMPVVIETLSHYPLETLPGHDGVTWLDRELASSEPVRLAGGFGAEVRSAGIQRQQWLVEQDLAEADANGVRLRANMLATLRQRELNQVAGQLSEELGLAYRPAQRGVSVEGTLRSQVRVGDSKFAVIEKSREFTLVPWRPVLERQLGKQVSGIIRESGVSWTIGRSRGLGIS